MSNNFWDQHYSKFNISEPSDFAKFCMEKHLNSKLPILEFGCGNGRDGLFFMKNNFNYTGYDISKSAVLKFKESLVDLEIKSQILNKSFVDFEVNTNDEIQIYSRFTLHSIDLKSQEIILNKLKQLNTQFTFFLEVRTIYDEFFGKGKKLEKNEFVDTHYRRFIDPREFINIINKDFNIEYLKLSKGLAKFKNEDPTVLRMIFSN